MFHLFHLFSYRCILHSTTGVLPVELMIGLQLCSQLDLPKILLEPHVEHNQQIRRKDTISMLMSNSVVFWLCHFLAKASFTQDLCPCTVKLNDGWTVRQHHDHVRMHHDLLSEPLLVLEQFVKPAAESLRWTWSATRVTSIKLGSKTVCSSVVCYHSLNVIIF